MTAVGARHGSTLAVTVVLAVGAAGACTGESSTSSTAPPFGAEVTAIPTETAVSGSAGASVAATAPTPTPPPTAPVTGSVPPAATATPPSAPAAVDLGPLGVLDVHLDPDGTLALLPALQLFAAGYAALPEIAPASQPLDDGGPALRTILAQLDDLSSEQAAIVSRVAEQQGRSLEEAAGAGGRLADAAGLVVLSLGRFGEQLHRSLPDDVQVTILELPYENADGTHNFSSPQAIATALPLTSTTDRPYDECRIRINADAPVDGPADTAFMSAIAQETFHCLQFGQRPYGAGVPLWAFEGAAAFAGEDFAQGSVLSLPWWERWIAEPERPLDRRTYDAAGFFFMLLDAEIDAYRFADVLLSEATADSVRRRLESTSIFDRWGSQYATEPTWGARYTVAGVAVPAIRAPQSTLALVVDGPPVGAAGLTASSAMSATPYRFVVPGDVLVVTSGAGDRGWLRFGDGTEQLLSQATQSFCLRPDGCACPGAPPESASAAAVASTEVFVGVGPFSGDGPQLAARSLQQWCNEVLVPAPPADSLDPCLAAAWTSTGYTVSPVDGVAQQVTGGTGAVLRLEADGTAQVDLDQTEPVAITATDAAGAVTTTTLVYRGRGDGRWSAAGGVVNITDVPTASFTLRVTVATSGGGVLADATIPAGDPRLGAYAGFLGTGRYQCTAGLFTLTHVTPSVGGAAAFTFG